MLQVVVILFSRGTVDRYVIEEHEYVVTQYIPKYVIHGFPGW